MALLKNLLTSTSSPTGSHATRVEARMSEEERERELERLRQENDTSRSNEEAERYQRKLRSMRARGIPLRLVSRSDWEKRRARISQRHHQVA